MEFLVEIHVNLADVPEERQAQLRDAEARRGRELLAAGKLRRIWRIPGRLAAPAPRPVAGTERSIS